MSKFRIFEFRINGEKEWVAARTFIEAIQTHSNITTMDLVEYDSTDEIVEIPEAEWDKITITDPENEFPDKTLKEAIQEVNSPEIIATSVY
jgi:hypothetical protein